MPGRPDLLPGLPQLPGQLLLLLRALRRGALGQRALHRAARIMLLALHHTREGKRYCSDRYWHAAEKEARSYTDHIDGV